MAATLVQAIGLLRDDESEKVMRRISILFLCLIGCPSVAVAHAGHLVDVAGHDHLLAGAAIGIAIAIGVAGALKGARRDEDEADEADAVEPEMKEA